MDEYVDVRVFVKDEKGTHEITGVSVSKNSKIGNIKKYFLERYPDFNLRFFPNKKLEIRNIFLHSSTTYDNHDLSSIFDKMKNPILILFRDSEDILPDLSTLKIK